LRKRELSRKGSALILTIFLIIVLEFIGMTFLARVQGEMAQTTRDVTSYYVVQTGLSDTLEWLQNRANLNVLDNAVLTLPTGTDPNEPPLMQTYYQREGVTSGTPLPSGWTWRVRLFPDQFTAGNANLTGANSAHCYKAVIDAIDINTGGNGTVRRRAVAWLHQGSFAQFSYFFGQFATGSNLWLNLSTFRVEGPFHTNGRLRLSIPSSMDWENLGPGNDGSTANFQSMSTYASTDSSTPDGIEYNTSTRPYDSTTLLPINLTIPGKTRYDRVARLGQAGLKPDNPINMPAVSSLLLEAAWGEASMPPTPRHGFNINPGNVVETLSAGGASVPVAKNVNGVLLVGNDIDAFQMQVGNDSQFPINNAALRGANNDNASFLLRQSSGGTPRTRRLTQTYSTTVLNPGGTWTINGVSVSGSMTIPAGYTLVQNDTNVKSYELYKDYGNGLFYGVQNIRGLEGKNKGRHTISVNQTTNKEVHITDELLRADVTPGTKPTMGTTRDQLGVVGYAIRFARYRTDVNTGTTTQINRSQWSPNDPLHVYAALFAGKPGDPNANSDTAGGGVGTIDYSTSSIGAGAFRVYGSLTENIRQAKGTFNSTTGQGTSGMSYRYDYDPNFQNVQPPYFPAQSNFEVRSWSDQPISEDA
jgi:hypothetical protein